MKKPDPENKLTLLFLIEKMDLPLNRGQITDYIIKDALMDYFTLQKTLAELIEGGYLEAETQDNKTLYSITDEGLNILEMFGKRISSEVRAKINAFVKEQKREIQREFENTAIFFPGADGLEYLVKCGVYEEGRVLMELSLTVDTRDQARLIQSNWKENAKIIYGEIIRALAAKREIK